MAGGSGYAGKPRPVLIVQDDAFDSRDSVTVCLITTDSTDLPVFRVPVEPTASAPCRAAVLVPASAAWRMTTCCASTARCWCFWGWLADRCLRLFIAASPPAPRSPAGWGYPLKVDRFLSLAE